MTPTQLPTSQTVLLLHGPRQPYDVTTGYPLPELQNGREILVQTETLGLNPIDWKAPDFNFGIPELPYIAGRELAGRVVKTSHSTQRFKVGDLVLVISTDYRDLRKAGFQQYVVSFDFNTARIPPNICSQAGATIGVAYVAAVLSLGICMGVDFSSVLDGPNLLQIVRSIEPEALPEDIRRECRSGIDSHDKAVAGDWIAIWGGKVDLSQCSSTSANLAVQLARLAGLRVVTIVDKAKHGLRLSNHQLLKPDLLVDSHDPDRAVAIIKANVGKNLRFALDTTGRESARSLLAALWKPYGDAVLEDGRATPPPSPPETPRGSTSLSSHLIGLTGLPKESAPSGVVYHKVPIKLFHEVPAVGESLVLWLERLLEMGKLTPPEILASESGFDGVNRALDRMRKGDIRGGRMVVNLT
ncbi:GroES-like protein [Sodiomyces alkalinus F11]|uniref:GroES-like protein n=1 Tax=Sodiomyces alkalinus (strain CBS 110278 / VKM F-3762 / F11) TaxID=1314773 RepID=A0A3N2PNS5_SODAK|nr:GroES-like protein [Sodiomyces alkalinus F11]ROT36084.1 GroES-like protein [Sodiomyces alkalinus F11]